MFTKKVVLLILLGFLFGHLFFRIYEYRNNYTTTYDPVYWEKRYGESQWVDFRSEKPIGDDGLYAYAGWKYIHGANPVLINAEMPFLGKYLVGLTIVTFRNQNIFAVLTGIFALAAYYFLNTAVFKNRLVALLPVVLFSFEPLFYEQIRAPFFDLLQLSFLFLIFGFALRKNFILSSLMVGCFAATKFPFQAIIPVVTIFIWLLLIEKKKSEVKRLAISLPLAAPVYLLTYLWYFVLGHSLIDFLKVQKYIANFYSIGAKAPMFGTVFPMFFQGTWYTHFGTIVDVPEWHFGWTVLSITALVAMFFVKQKTRPIVFLIVWIVLYMAFLSYAPVFPRYLLLLLPFLYNLAIWVISKSIPGKLSLLQE